MLAAAQAADPGPRVVAGLTATLDAITLGASHDHGGGGFHRYTVDRAWSMPHFEKMLYNNAQLLKLCAEAWAATRRPPYRRAAADTARYLERRMSAPEGGCPMALTGLLSRGYPLDLRPVACPRT